MFPIGPGMSDVPRARKTAKEIARRHTIRAIKKQAALMDQAESEAVQLAASQALLNRGWGQPTQDHEISGKDGGPIVVVTGVPRDDDAA